MCVYVNTYIHTHTQSISMPTKVFGMEKILSPPGSLFSWLNFQTAQLFLNTVLNSLYFTEQIKTLPDG